MQSVSSDYFDYYFGWENSRYAVARMQVNLLRAMLLVSYLICICTVLPL